MPQILLIVQLQVQSMIYQMVMKLCVYYPMLVAVCLCLCNKGFLLVQYLNL